MGKDVNGAAMLRSNARGEDEDFTRVIATEHDELGVKLQRLGVVQVHITRDMVSGVHWRARCRFPVQQRRCTQVRTWASWAATLRLSDAAQRLQGALLMQHGTAVLLFELTSSLSLFPFDALTFGFGEHLFVLDTKLTSVDIHAVHGFNNDASVLGRLEVGKGQTTEYAVVEVVVEGIWLWEVHFKHHGGEAFFADSKRNVLDDNGGRDELLAVGSRGSDIGRRVM